MLNQVILIGRIAKDIELRTTPSGKKVANTTLATSKKFKNQSGELIEKAEFHNLVVWQGAENFAKYLSKGSKASIIGELATRMWEKDGQKHYTTEIIVNQFIFLESKRVEDKEIKEPYEEIDEEKDSDVNNIPF